MGTLRAELSRQAAHDLPVWTCKPLWISAIASWPVIKTGLPEDSLSMYAQAATSQNYLFDRILSTKALIDIDQACSCFIHRCNGFLNAVQVPGRAVHSRTPSQTERRPQSRQDSASARWTARKTMTPGLPSATLNPSLKLLLWRRLTAVAAQQTGLSLWACLR